MTGVLKKKEGQALVETALILVLLLILVVGLSEFARAWFTKNSLKNAVRQGARVAVVTLNISDISDTQCPTANPCTIGNPIIYAVCCQPGVPRESENNTRVSLDVVGKTTPAIASDEIKVRAISTFYFVIGGSPWPWSKSIDFDVSASMRYE